jgi:hypothetical protein
MHWKKLKENFSLKYLFEINEYEKNNNNNKETKKCLSQ